MSSFVTRFTNFIKEQGIVGLAVGLAIGIQASNTVSAIVDNFINPLVGLLLNGTDLSGIFSTVERNGETLVFGWGNILQAVITLLVTAFVVYYIVEKSGLSKKK